MNQNLLSIPRNGLRLALQASALCALTLAAIALPSLAQAEERPNIWVRPSDRAAILEKIETQDWAAKLYQQLKSRADEAVATHRKDPAAYIRQLSFEGESSSGHPQLMVIKNDRDRPHQAGGPARMALMTLLQEAIDCGVLYYLTGDETYAQVGADVLSAFARGVEEIEPTIKHNGGLLYDRNHLKEARIFGAQVPIVYDFIHPYLAKGGGALNLATGQREAFPFELAQRVFRIYIERALNTGIVNCNWPVLESSSLVHNTLALEDPAEREKYLPYYLEIDTKNQDSLRRVAEIYRESGGVWPEPQGYASYVGHYSTFLMTLLQRRDPSLKLGQRYPEPAASLIRDEYLRFPNGDIMTLGDAHGERAHPPLYEAFELAYHLAKIGEQLDQANIYGGIIKEGIAKGQYDRSQLKERDTSAAPYYTPTQLLWQEPVVEGEFKLAALPRTDDIAFAGLFLQRNLSSADEVQDSLMAFNAAGHFVHAHATGLHAEFYGKGQVLGLRAGTGQYGSELHENFYAMPASGNTVISNGASATAGGWVNRKINQAELSAMEPMPRQAAVSPDHSFSTTNYLDEYNTVAPAEHQRTIALVRTSPTTGYYVDIFRARSDDKGQFHDYLYRNLGETLDIATSQGRTLAFTPTPDRYPVAPNINPKVNGSYDHPGWSFLEELQTAPFGESGLTGSFVAKGFGKLPLGMRFHLPKIGASEITTALSPPSLNSYGTYRTKTKTPMFLLRQQGEAWDRPFAAIYEPTIGLKDKGSVTSVEALTADNKFCGLKVQSSVEKKTITQYILVLQPGQSFALPEADLSFEGHFAIVTLEGNGQSGSLYLGSGEKLSCGEHEIANAPAYLSW